MSTQCPTGPETAVVLDGDPGALSKRVSTLAAHGTGQDGAVSPGAHKSPNHLGEALPGSAARCRAVGALLTSSVPVPHVWNGVKNRRTSQGPVAFNDPSVNHARNVAAVITAAEGHTKDKKTCSQSMGLRHRPECHGETSPLSCSPGERPASAVGVVKAHHPQPRLEERQRPRPQCPGAASRPQALCPLTPNQISS